MSIFKYFIAPVVLSLLSMLSCSSEEGRPYTIVEGTAQPTRLYMLANGIRVYITPEEKQPRTIAAICIPTTSKDTIANLFTSAPLAPDYPLLLAQTGTKESLITKRENFLTIQNNIPSNETENWAIIMSGTLTTLPDSAFIVLKGGAECNTAVEQIEKQFTKLPRSSSEKAIAHKVVCNIIDSLGNPTHGTEIASYLNSSNREAATASGIKLQPSPPYLISFPDNSDIDCKTANGPTTFRSGKEEALTLYPMKEISSPMLQMVAKFINSSSGIDAVAIDGAILLHTDSRLPDTIADSKKFQLFLDKHKESLETEKQKPGNIASQISQYLDMELQTPNGLHNIATQCMNVLKQSAARATPSSKHEEEIPAYYLLPKDIDTTLTIVATTPLGDIEEHAAAMIFNKATELTGKNLHIARHDNGTYMYSCEKPERLPFTGKEYEAAKAYLMYEYSTKRVTGSALLAEIATEQHRGYTAMELYDALCALSLNDIEDFHIAKCESSTATFIVGRQSNIDQHRLAKQGTMVHITFDELYGY